MSNLFNTYARYPFDLVSGHDWHLVDNHGKTYLDMTAGIGVCSFGYNDPEITGAVEAQLSQVWHTSNLYESQLQETVGGLLAGPDKLAFFCNSGTEANEAAFKLARKATGKTRVLAFNNGFHGRTYGAMSLTGNPAIQAGFAPLVPDVVFADYNDPQALDQIDADLAAVILEVIQGEGGVYVGDQAWLQSVQAKCHATNTLLIIDEVQSGIGRTGYKFAYEAFGLDPDIVTMAKALANGLPIGAMIGKKALGPAFTPGSHGTTFGGNKLALSAAEQVLTKLTPAFLATVQQKADAVWTTLSDTIAPLKAVNGISGMGLMIGIHLDESVPVDAVIAKLQALGILTLSAKHNTLRLLPPLIMSQADLLAGLAQIATVLKEAAV
ncbi:acetylornithine transaminase [Lacticaseibacillus baoqingensis]|uniref:Acetylornithine transaminase n=1 Tax=Lacticaseibacillus baoqingensis TaxID=2486013 RepID=A0ABW4E1I6_9LACO|nr:acetylornithine transaminase [Lacticaseibacillus baoqingensis]